MCLCAGMSACVSLAVVGAAAGADRIAVLTCDDDDAWRSGESLALFSRG
jgi:hypothetical protein